MKRLVEQIGKIPKGIEWVSKNSSDNRYNSCKAGILGNDAFLVLKATYRNSWLKPVCFAIRDFRTKRLCDIEMEILEETDSSDTWPMGRCFHDCLEDLCGYGLDSCMKITCLKQNSVMD